MQSFTTTALKARRNTTQIRLKFAIPALALAVFTAATGHCSAGLVVTFQSSTVAQGGTGTLEVDLLNNSMTTGVQISSFQLELSQPSGTGLTFTSATTGTTAYPYIFAGNSADDTYFGGSQFPIIDETSIAGSDTINDPDTFATLAAGESVGLALLTFSVDPAAAPGSVPITVVPFSLTGSTDGTLLAEYSDLASIPFTADIGSITVAPATVGEPSSLWLGAVGSLAVLALAGKRRCGSIDGGAPRQQEYRENRHASQADQPEHIEVGKVSAHPVGSHQRNLRRRVWTYAESPV